MHEPAHAITCTNTHSTQRRPGAGARQARPQRGTDREIHNNTTRETQHTTTNTHNDVYTYTYIHTMYTHILYTMHYHGVGGAIHTVYTQYTTHTVYRGTIQGYKKGVK